MTFYAFWVLLRIYCCCKKFNELAIVLKTPNLDKQKIFLIIL